MAIAFTWNPEEYRVLVSSCEWDSATPYIQEHMPPGSRVLEAGCGLARYVDFLSARGYHATGVEVSAETVDQVARLAPNLDVRVGDVTALEFDEGTFDGAISLGVVEHFPAGPHGPLAEMCRVLKPGGVAVVTVPSFNHLRRIKFSLGRLMAALNVMEHARRCARLRKLMGKASLADTGSRCPHSLPYRHRHRYSLKGFYQYLLGPREFEEALREAGFEILESVPIALLDGIHHEISKRLVRWENWRCEASGPGRALNWLLSRVPFGHNHMHLCIARKPLS